MGKRDLGEGIEGEPLRGRPSPEIYIAEARKLILKVKEGSRGESRVEQEETMLERAEKYLNEAEDLVSEIPEDTFRGRIVRGDLSYYRAELMELRGQNADQYFRKAHDHYMDGIRIKEESLRKYRSRLQEILSHGRTAIFKRLLNRLLKSRRENRGAGEIEGPLERARALAYVARALAGAGDAEGAKEEIARLILGMLPYPTDPPVITFLRDLGIFRPLIKEELLKVSRILDFIKGKVPGPPPEPEVLAPLIAPLWRAHRAVRRITRRRAITGDEPRKMLLSFKDVLPFSIKPVGREEDLFVDRDEYDELESLILRTSGIFAVIGKRGYGKSSILRKLMADLERSGWICVSLEVPMPYDPKDLLTLMLKDLAEKITYLDIKELRGKHAQEKLNSLRRRASQILEDLTYEKMEEKGSSRGIGLSPLPQPSGSLSYAKWSKEARRKYRQSLPGLVSELKALVRDAVSILGEVRGQVGVAILIDELDKLEDIGDEKTFDRFMDLIRTISHVPRMYVIFAALPSQIKIPKYEKTEEDLRIRVEELDNAAYSTIDSYVVLRPAKEELIRRIIERRINRAGLRQIFDESAVDEIVRISNGVPREAIRLMADSFFHGLVKGEDVITAETVREVVERTMEPFREDEMRVTW